MRIRLRAHRSRARGPREMDGLCHPVPTRAVGSGRGRAIPSPGAQPAAGPGLARRRGMINLTIRPLRSLALALSPLLVVLAGCGEESTQGPTGTIPEQLEALVVAGDTSYEEVQHQGALAVSGGERDFALDVAVAAGAAKIDVHTPGSSDLSTLDGLTATVALAPMGLHEERSVVITDDAGPLYVADVGHGVDVDALFGEGFVQWGEVAGTDSDELYDWEYTSAVFKTDNGEVPVLPGETATLALGGATYRVAVIAAYKVTPHEDAALPCGGISDLLSYEMLRLKAAPEPVKLTRLANAQLAHLGCMADD